MSISRQNVNLSGILANKNRSSKENTERKTKRRKKDENIQEWMVRVETYLKTQEKKRRKRQLHPLSKLHNSCGISEN